MINLQTKLQTFLTPYQRAFVLDGTKKIIVLKSRRIGMSEAATIKALVKATKIPSHDVHLVSRSFREAKELLRTAAKWVEAFAQLGVLENPTVTATKIELDNRSRIIALPSKAVRSRGGTVILDETADIQHARDVYNACAPAVESDEHGQLILISTPLGKSGLFYDVWENESGAYDAWSRHYVDVYKAFDAGATWLPDPQQLKDEYTEEQWLQEFCCQFLGDKDQYFSYDLLRRASLATSAMPTSFDELYCGIDIGTTSDASVVATVGLKDDVHYVSDVTFIKEPGKTRDLTPQYEDINALLRDHAYDVIAADGAGIGTQIAQDLEEDYDATYVWDSGDWRKKPAKVVPRIKKMLEDGELKIVDDRRLLSAFAKIKRKERTDRTPRFYANKDATTGHADAFFATMMGIDAALGDDKPAFAFVV